MTQPVSGLGPGQRSHGAWAVAFALSFALGLATAAWGTVPSPPAHARASRARHAVVVAERASAKPVARAHAAARTKEIATTKPKAKGRKAMTPVQRSSAREARQRSIPARKLTALSHPLPAARHADAVSPAKPLPTGGELSPDEFFRVAGASPNPRPAARPEAADAPAATDPDEPLAKPSDVPSRDLPSRIAALTHPSHEDLAEEVAVPVMLPGLYRNGRLVVPAPLKGSHEILVHQNQMADDEGLERVRNDAALNKLRASRQLVDFPETASLRLNPELSAQRRCARVWTVKFAQDMAKAYYAEFHEPLMVSSAVRTIAYQLRLRRTNGNAAGTGGEAASPHLTGQAVDFGKSGMSIEEIAWMRAYLKPLMDAGKVDVEEEFQQACFHISVYKTYLPVQKHATAEVAQMRKPVVVEPVGR